VKNISTSSFSRNLVLVAPVCLLTALALPGFGAQFSLPDKDSPEVAWWRESMKTRDERLQWWREARFGMFVHWGVYSGLGGTWQGHPVKGYAEHIQRILKIPIPVYREQVAGKFNPTEFNADEWIRAARDAGMGYFIITAKHHDGFAMFDSKTNDYNIVQATPFKRDPMKELKAACQKYGLKFGFYYSHAFDWGEPNAPGNDWDYDNPGGDRNLHGGRNWWESYPELVTKARSYVDQKAIPQLLELIKTYDPDILWFDTPQKLPDSENLRILKAVRDASPRVVINGRLVRNWGDYLSTADRPAEFSPHEGDWEGIPTTNESYGYNQNDHSHKPVSHFIQILAKAAARGGNILMNVGPMGNGKIAPEDLAILKGIGQWWKTNGESIRGTSRTPLAVQAWGESTRKGDALYLHVFAWPREGKLVVGGLRTGVKSAHLLSDPKHANLVTERVNPLDVLIKVPAGAPDQVDSVVVLQCEAEPVGDTTRLLSLSGTNVLRAFDGELRGTLRFGPGKTRDAYVENWTKVRDSVFWRLRLNKNCSFEVRMDYDGPVDSAGGTFTLTMGTNRLSGVVQQGEKHGVKMGSINVQPGNFELRLAPEQIHGSELMRLRAITLIPMPRS
jgi:alpha-L-fucosidase